MNTTQAYKILISEFDRIRSLHPVDVRYPSRTFQVEGRSAPYLSLEVYLATHSTQLTLGIPADIRWYNMLTITAVTREGEGFLEAHELVRPFLEGLASQSFAGVFTDTVSSSRMAVLQGWEHRPYLIPFWHTSPAQL